MAVFKTKAHTLLSLNLKKSIIPKIYIIKSLKYKTYKDKYLNEIAKKFYNKKIAIRSSFSDEDGNLSSGAGKYKSFLNISSKEKKEINDKILQVLASKKILRKNDYLFIQEMVEKVSFSGVILTRSLEDYSRCININYFEGANTEAVTSGRYKTKNLIYYNNKKYPIPKKFKKLYSSINEIFKITKNYDLDIEFAVNKNNKIFILQVRKLILPNKIVDTLNKPELYLSKLEKKILKLQQKHHDLYGNTTFFGNMPDWNPAEIIGTKPRPLALSLYQELITDHIWSKNRLNYGYKDLGQFHLMTSFYGTPYVDVRIDFNSWLPKNLNKKVSNKIINYYLKKFKDNSSLQDKVEFEVLFTCASFATLKRLKKDLKGILTKNEIRVFYNSLKNINKNALNQKKVDLESIEVLKDKQSIIQKSNLYELDKIYWLVEDCKKFGTLPFAGLARCGFIGIEILNSMVDTNIITENDKNKFLAQINTITSDMKFDLNKLSKNKFIEKYGHLRPGTYEINIENYKDGFDKYFGKIKKIKLKKAKQYDLSKKIKKHIYKFKFYKNSKSLLKFIGESIAGREYSKFIFSKNVDLIFENLKKFGKKYKISNNDLSFIKIDKILEMYFNLSNSPTINDIKNHIEENKRQYISNKNINLPDVILSGKDLYIQYKKFDKINFISNKKITSNIIVFNKSNIKKDYNGIVCIENADPGFDFLFSKNIKGLITKYGGLNSHMAIRCSELNLPALIGVGEKNFNEFIKFKLLSIDCISKKIEKIN